MESSRPAEHTRLPLPPGTVIEYCGDLAVVVRDPGGEGRVTVKVRGRVTHWRWTFEGVSCSVVSLPGGSRRTMKPETPS